MTSDRFLLKDLLTPETVAPLGALVRAELPTFDQARFMGRVFDDGWGDLELKQRTRRITECLAAELPDDYGDAIEILRRAAAKAGDLGWTAMVFSDYVEAYGVDDPDTSLPALGDFTRNASAEFAVRPFILRYPDRMYVQHLTWARDPDWRVRRLASEGCRPRLPWGMALKPLQQDPSPILPVLEELRHDVSEDVRRSVANNLNDIAKDHPDVTVRVLEDWQDGTPEIAGITRHALRTLLKRGDPAALELLGYRREAKMEVTGLHCDPETVSIGDDTRVRFSLTSTDAATRKVLADIVVGFVKANGSTTPKVFRAKSLELGPGETTEVSRSITLRQLSTRTVYPGTHTVDIQVNGIVRASTTFEVV